MIRRMLVDGGILLWWLVFDWLDYDQVGLHWMQVYEMMQ